MQDRQKVSVLTDLRSEGNDIVYSKLDDSPETSFSLASSLKESVFVTSPQTKYFSNDGLESSRITISGKFNFKAPRAYDAIQEIYLTFHYSQFFEVFFCHMAHNVFFGPFSIPLLYIFFPRNFLENLGFYPTMRQYWIPQVLLWLCLVIYSVVACVRETPADERYHGPCVRLMWTLMVMNYTLRQMIISLKYGYFSREKYNHLKKHLIDAEAVTKDNSLFFWQSENRDELPMKELYSAIRRHEIELSLFYIDFMVKPEGQAEEKYKAKSEETKQKIFNYLEFEGITSGCRLQEMKTVQELTQNRYFAAGLADDMITEGLSKTRASVNFYIKLFIVLSFVASILPNFMSVVGTETHRAIFVFNFPKDLLGWILCPAFWIGNTVVLVFNYLSFSLGVLNARLRYGMMKQLNYMISPRKKIWNEGIKRYPTINLFDSIPLKSWSNLKRITIDYAKKYQKRAETGVTFQILFYVAFMIFLLIQIFGTDGRIYDYRALIIVWYQLSVAIGFTIILMNTVAQTNATYKIMQGHVKEVRDILSDFLLLKCDYLENDENPKNLLYRVFSNKLRSEFKDCENREQFVTASVDYLKNLIACYDDIIDEINFEEENHPARALGIALTIPTLKRVAVGALSVIFSVSTYLIHHST